MISEGFENTDKEVPDSASEEKIQKLIDCILKAAAGDRSAFFDFSPDGDSVDAIGLAYNSLLEEVRSSHDQREKDLLAWRRALHDIRGPISSIPLLIETLTQARHRGETSEDASAQILSAIAASCKIMLSKISHALTGEYAAAISTEKIYIRDLVEEAVTVSMINQLLANYTISLSVPDDFMLFSDRHLLLSVVKNLIENSCKYRRPEVPGLLNISAFNKAGKSVIRFADNGTGIQREHISRIFQAYTQLNEKAEGLGYGLYSVKRDVEALGGDISVSSIFGHGVTIEVSLDQVTDSNAFRRKKDIT